MFKNMKLGTKIAGGFAIVLILTAVVGYVGFNGLTGVIDIVDKADDGNRMIKQIQAARQQEKNFIIRGDEQYVQRVDEQIQELSNQAQQTKDKMEDTTDRDQMDKVAKSTEDYKKEFEQYINLAKQKDKVEATLVENARDLIAVSETIRAEQKEQLEELSLDSELTEDTELILDILESDEDESLLIDELDSLLSELSLDQELIELILDILDHEL